MGGRGNQGGKDSLVQLIHSKTMRHLFFFLCLFFLFVSPVQSRPDVVREGISYYSDKFSEKGVVRDIVSDKNYEEVYQLYTYYEVVYDAQARVAVFKEYKRGEVISEDRYRYDDKGILIEHIVLIPGKPAKAMKLHQSKIEQGMTNND